MSDPFANSAASLSGPATDAFTITPNDTTDLAAVTRAVYIGSTGDLSVIMKSGTQATLADVPAGTVLPVRVSRILATGTTAGNLLGLL